MVHAIREHRTPNQNLQKNGQVARNLGTIVAERWQMPGAEISSMSQYFQPHLPIRQPSTLILARTRDPAAT